MADVTRELANVGVVTPFPEFAGTRVPSDKRCFAGKHPDTKDAEGKVTKRGKAIPTMNKVELRLPVPTTEEESQEYYKVSLATLVGMGVRQRAYTLNKSDIYLSEIGEKTIDLPGLTTLVEADLPIVPRTGGTSVVREKAAKQDEYLSLGKSAGLTEAEIDEVIRKALAKKLSKK